MSSSNNKMKGLLKGLRYISEIFENEKEPEMQIGLPTDVKHVAHIGWDGPSAVKSAPSWMNEFKSSPANDGEAREEEPRKSVSQETETTEAPKPSKRGSSSSTRNDSAGESTGKEKSDKPKHSKKSSKSTSSKETSDGVSKPKKKPKEHKEPKEPKDPTDPDNPKKSSRRNKSKDSVEGSSRRSKTRDLDAASDSGSIAGSGFEGEF
ncbi:hypothetical protein V6N13_071588 [Hibiscus sabdariffa]|uniref:CRIB domain-containing protein n=1 Tax=Hibiscus sabdariffa TaxID=183260 RepID=A0ABR2TDQ5_9ROSI